MSDERRVVIGSDGEGLAGYAEVVGDLMATDDTGLYLCDGHLYVLRTTGSGKLRFEQTRMTKAAAIVQDSRRPGRYVVAMDKRGQPKMLTDDVMRLAMETLRDVAAALMACTRTTMRTAPAVVIEAPIPRSGKTLLAETLGMMAPNRDDDASIATSIPDKEEELEKRLTAFAGEPVGGW